MAFNLDQALEQLRTGAYSTVESLFSLVQQTSGKCEFATENAISLLYSGKLSNDIYASSTATLISELSKISDEAKPVVNVADSDAGRLLNNTDFRNALLESFNEYENRPQD